MVPGGPRSTAIAPASMNHAAILSWMKAPSRFSLSLLSAAMRITRKPILRHRVEVKHVVLIRQRRLLQIGEVPAVGVLLHERLPARAPGRRLAEGAHRRGADRAAVGIDPEIAATDEVEPGMVEIIVGP